MCDLFQYVIDWYRNLSEGWRVWIQVSIVISFFLFFSISNIFNFDNNFLESYGLTLIKNTNISAEVFAAFLINFFIMLLSCKEKIKIFRLRQSFILGISSSYSGLMLVIFNMQGSGTLFFTISSIIFMALFIGSYFRNWKGK